MDPVVGVGATGRGKGAQVSEARVVGVEVFAVIGRPVDAVVRAICNSKANC